MKKIIVVTWHSHSQIFRDAAKELNLYLKFYSTRDIDSNQDLMKEMFENIDSADAVLFNVTSDNLWDQIYEHMKDLKEKKVISVGNDPSNWSMTTVDHEIAISAYKYLLNNDYTNIRSLLLFILKELCDENVNVPEPVEIPWNGIIHPDLKDHIFESTEEYKAWYGEDQSKPWIGIVAFRTRWLTDGCTIEYQVLKDLESQGAKVILVFTMSHTDDNKGSIGVAETIDKYFVRDGMPIVDSIVKLTGLPILYKDRKDEGRIVHGSEFFSRLGIPIFQPVVSGKMSIEKWVESIGLTAMDISNAVAMPEFEGVIEPMMIGSSYQQGEDTHNAFITDRTKRLAERVVKRIKLKRIPMSDKKVVFFLNNFPCAGLEANIGSASHLDTHESLARILKAMKEHGYDITVPENGKELIENILSHKAMSEFRWTTVNEIDAHGGTIHKMDMGEYVSYFKTLTPKTQKAVNNMWGEPPGKGMVLDDDIIITGISYGNVMIAVQPKRGCYGARCDGEVCKILHDPLCPPTHQYLASYHYYEDIWGADVVVHVGTHGNLEFLPGKGCGMSEDCFPDICIGKAPHIYIYNSDNPPEGTIAKRRSYATLVDHMQVVMTNSSLYEALDDLDRILEDYQTARFDPSHSHQLKHLIIEAVDKANLKELNLTHDTPLDECVSKCHEALSKIRNSQMNKGMHIFGNIPLGMDRVEMVNSILRYDAGDGSIRDVISDIMGVDLISLFSDQRGYNMDFNLSNGALIEKVGLITKEYIAKIIEGMAPVDALYALKIPADERYMEELKKQTSKIEDICKRLDDSDEIGAFLGALDGRYTPPGPSGIITRGRPDVLPSGRNFYSMDPYSLPKKSSWNVGRILADSLIEKYVKENGEMPENVAIHWMSPDLMAADGEIMSQMFSLIGAEPIWETNLQVRSFRIIPRNMMAHPRIDLTVRMSGVIRDMFMNCVNLLDDAILQISQLDEPTDFNFIRKHVLDSMAEGADEEEATTRFFSAPPGAYSSSVNLAVYASSWKTDQDLADIYVAGNGYGYGKDRNGKGMHGQFAANLSTVNVTYNKTATDEQDLLGCCCYFGNLGGITVAARCLSGNDVKTYYGDTREPKDINVHTLADEIRRTVRTKLLNPAWIDAMKAHGYKGAADFMKRIGRVYGWSATTHEVDAWIFDDITSTFVNDPEMKKFFQENNPYALEEIARRMLEANQRGLWDADEKIFEELKENYVEIESWMEELAGEGEYQGGSIDIITSQEVEGWNANLSEITADINKRMIVKKSKIQF